MRSEQIAEIGRGKIEKMARVLIQIEVALEDLKLPNPHFIYADIGDRLRLLLQTLGQQLLGAEV